MKRITGSAPFMVEEIIFEDGSTMTDKLVSLFDGFVLVETEEGEPPTVYNANMIRELRRCDASRQRASVRHDDDWTSNVDWNHNVWR